MYVLHEALGLPEEKMIAPMDEKRGRLLLAEILDGGNFDRHFTKYAGFTHQSMGKKCKHPTPILAVWTISATFAPC